MLELSHASLEQHHYEAVRTNPAYRAMGLAGVLFEEVMMNMPIPRPEPAPEKPVPEPEWTKQQWDMVRQTQALAVHTYTKLLELQQKKKHTGLAQRDSL